MDTKLKGVIHDITCNMDVKKIRRRNQKNSLFKVIFEILERKKRVLNGNFEVEVEGSVSVKKFKRDLIGKFITCYINNISLKGTPKPLRDELLKVLLRDIDYVSRRSFPRERVKDSQITCIP